MITDENLFQFINVEILGGIDLPAKVFIIFFKNSLY